MRNRVVFLFAILVATVSYRCGDGAGSGLTIKGTIQNAGNMQVYLDKVGINPGSANLVVGKADTDGSGNYTLSFEQPVSEGLYRLRVGEQKVNLILDGKERKMNVSGNLAALNMYEYTVQGSDGSETYLSIIKKFIAQQPKVEDIRNIVDTTANPIVGMLIALQALGNSTTGLDIHTKAAQKVEQAYPGSEYSRDYQAFVASVQQAASNPAPGGTDFSFLDEASRKPAPDIKLPSPKGKQYALSQLKGKVVLLDFWASWCGPCRRENPSVVNIYNKYKDKGFTVFSVSLDGVDSRQAAMVQNDPKQLKEFEKSAKTMWKEAIEKDGLVWDYHVSDLKKWECAPARLYGVSSIPRTFMIDKEGRIAAVNLRGAEQIEQTLLKLL